MLVLINLLLLAMYFLSTRMSRPLMYALVQEDSIGEWLQFSFYTLCTLILFLYSKKESVKARKYYFISLSVIFALVTLEEISWGQRIFGFRIDSIQNINTQGEVNIHNIFNLIGNTFIYKFFSFSMAFIAPIAEKIVSTRLGFERFLNRIDYILSFIILFVLYIFVDQETYVYFYEFTELIISFSFLWVFIFDSKNKFRLKSSNCF